MTPPGLGFVAANDRARRGAQEGRAAHALLGLDRPRGRAALPEIRRHAARASAVRPAPGARHAVRGRPRERVPAPRLLAEAVRRAVGALGGGPGDRLQHHRAGERSNSVTTRADERPRSGGAARLLPREVRRDPGPRHRRAVRQGVPHRPHGPRQRADGARHARRDRDGARPRWAFRTARAASRRPSSISGARCAPSVRRLENDVRGMAADGESPVPTLPRIR